MRVLAVDTTTPRQGVAVVEKGGLLGEVRLDGLDGHSHTLLPAIAFLLERLGLEPAAVEGYAVTTGPGSFTGVRVGLSTVQGLALGGRRPCLGLPALDVLAARMRGAAPHLAALMEAHRGEVFGRLYDADARPRGPLLAEAPADFIRRVPAGAAFLGDGALRHRELILASCPGARFPERSLFLAGTLGLLAEPRLAAGEGTGPEELRALYLRGADIRVPRP